MKKLVVAGALLGFAILGWAASPSIKSVVVYPQGCLVTETATVSLKVGVNSLDWGRLSPQVDADGIRVEIPDGAQVRLIDRNVEKVEAANETVARRAELTDALKKARAAQQEAEDALTVSNRNGEFLRQIQTAATTPVKGEMPTQFAAIPQWKDLIVFLNAGWESNLAEVRQKSQDLKKAQDEVARINREIDNLGRGESQTQMKLVLTLEALRAGDVLAEVSYFSPTATWEPSYQVWVDPAKGNVELSYGALVRQWGDADWTNVAMTLATARPQGGMTPPTPTPWWVRESRPMPVRAMNMKAARGQMTFGAVDMATASAMSADAQMDESAAAPEPVFAQVEVSSKLTNAEFVLPWKATVKNDNTSSKVTIATIPLAAELGYKVLPEFSTQAYLLGKVKNSSAFTLLPGTSSLYVDGSFVGKADLELVQPQESFDLSLGVDPAIKVQRKQLAKKTDLTGLMEENRKVTYRYEITVENLKASDVAIELVERTPLSQHEKIKVELLEPKELAKSIDKEGLLTWQLPLKAHEKRVLTLAYSIEYPKNLEVQGLK